jgi:uncharacterized membrane protein YgaE (UPF0421/DUF939 family)
MQTNQKSKIQKNCCKTNSDLLMKSRSVSEKSNSEKSLSHIEKLKWIKKQIIKYNKLYTIYQNNDKIFKVN